MTLIPKAGGWIADQIDLWLCMALCAASYALISTTSMQAPEGGAIATLVGALVGGAAVLLGAWINRSNERRRQRAIDAQRQEKIKTLIAGELADVAAGLIMATPLVQGGMAALRIGSQITAPTFHICVARPMPFTEGMGADLLHLERQALDSIITLRSNLALTRTILEELTASDPDEPFGHVKLSRVAAGLSHDMNTLAIAFEQIAPQRKIQLPNQEPELYASRLRRLSGELMDLIAPR